MNIVELPTVTVIVPVYKVEPYLRNCLNSLLNQTFKNWEAILVDDGSPDQCGLICDEYASQDNRFRVIHKKNGGQSSARNLALPISNGDYICFLDSDDFLSENALEELIALAHRYQADIVQCNYIRGDKTIFPEISDKIEIKILDNHDVFTQFVAKIIPWGKLYKKEVIGDIPFPEGIINEDDFTTWKFYYNAKTIVVTSEPLYYYTINPNSTMANQQRKPNLNYFNAYRERIAFFEQVGERDLEAISRIQWMKSLAMLYSNNQLTDEDRKEIKRIFTENYQSKSLKSVAIPSKLSIVFRAFNLFPVITSKIIKKLYRAGV